MNCTFRTYPADLEHKNVLEVCREPTGRKNGQRNADLQETKTNQKKNPNQNKVVCV